MYCSVVCSYCCCYYYKIQCLEISNGCITTTLFFCPLGSTASFSYVNKKECFLHFSYHCSENTSAFAVTTSPRADKVDAGTYDHHADAQTTSTSLECGACVHCARWCAVSDCYLYFTVIRPAVPNVCRKSSEYSSWMYARNETRTMNSFGILGNIIERKLDSAVMSVIWRWSHVSLASLLLYTSHLFRSSCK